VAITAGMTAYAADVNLATQKVIGRGERTTGTSTTTTTELAALRVDDIPLTGGRSYRVSSSCLIVDSSVAGDAITARLRITTDGTTPTTSSTLFGGILEHVSANGAQSASAIVRYYHPASDETLSVLLTVVRASGTGNASLIAATGFPIDIVIEDLGPSPTDTGVDL